MRKYRANSRLAGKARRNATARSYAHVYIARGKLVRQPCEVCGSLKTQVHHQDYTKPITEIRWFCREHHLAFEGKQMHKAEVERY